MEGKGDSFSPFASARRGELEVAKLEKTSESLGSAVSGGGAGQASSAGGGGAGSALGSIGSPGLEAVKDPSVLGQVHPQPQKLQWASACRESEVVSSEDRQGRAESSAVLCRSGKHYPR